MESVIYLHYVMVDNNIDIMFRTEQNCNSYTAHHRRNNHIR